MAAPQGDGLTEAAAELFACARTHAITIGTAESCTGGMVASSLASLPGVSEVFKGAVISYANEVKTALLGVEADTLSKEGAISEEVALQMAEGARAALMVDFAVSTTGIAGPDGGSEGKPVGTVWIAVAGKGKRSATLHHFSGTRNEIRQAATKAALQNLSQFIQMWVG